MRRNRRILAALGLVASFGLVAAACGDDSGSTSEDPTTTAASNETTTSAGETTTSGGAMTENMKVALLFNDVAGRGDLSFNDSAGKGLDKAKAEMSDLQATESAPTSSGDQTERLQKAVDDGNGLVIPVGFLFGDALNEIAPKATDTKFAIVDNPAGDNTNVTGLLFAEQEGSYLVGVAAGLKTTSKKVGFIGGVENDLIKKFEAGFVAGVKASNPDATVDVKYISQPPDFSGFNDAAKGKEIAQAMYEGGADIIYAAAGGSGLGMFEAAKDFSAKGTKVWGIGVDSDQYLTVGDALKEFVLTSMLKRVDVAVYSAIKAYTEGSLKAGDQIFDLKVDGVGYSTSGGYVDDIKDKLEAAKADIVSGKISVPTAP